MVCFACSTYHFQRKLWGRIELGWCSSDNPSRTAEKIWIIRFLLSHPQSTEGGWCRCWHQWNCKLANYESKVRLKFTTEVYMKSMCNSNVKLQDKVWFSAHYIIMCTISGALYSMLNMTDKCRGPKVYFLGSSVFKAFSHDLNQEWWRYNK